MTIVYDKKGQLYRVPFAVDVKEWLKKGYTLEPPKKKATTAK